MIGIGKDINCFSLNHVQMHRKWKWQRIWHTHTCSSNQTKMVNILLHVYTYISLFLMSTNQCPPFPILICKKDEKEELNQMPIFTCVLTGVHKTLIANDMQLKLLINNNNSKNIKYFTLLKFHHILRKWTGKSTYSTWVKYDRIVYIPCTSNVVNFKPNPTNCLSWIVHCC